MYIIPTAKNIWIGIPVTTLFDGPTYSTPEYIYKGLFIVKNNILFKI